MIKIDLMRSIAQKMGVTLMLADMFLDAFVESVAGELDVGGKVQLTGFGTFEVRAWGERPGRNPKTGEVLVIPPGKQPAFRAGKTLKVQVAGN